jgi:hypothetical protein
MSPTPPIRAGRAGRAGRLRVVAAAALVLATATAGCLPDEVDGRQEPVDAQPVLDLSWFEESSAAEVVDAGLVAMSEIGSVRLLQDADNPEAATDLDADAIVSKDLLIATGEGIGDAVDGDCTGTLQLPGWSEPAELVVEDDLGAFLGSTAFWLDFAGLDPAVLDQLADQYADEWTTVPGLATLCSFTDFLEPLTDLVGDEDVVKAGLGDVAGVPAGRVVSRTKKRTVTAWVRVAEPHLLLRLAVERRGRDVDTPGGVQRTVTTFTDTDSAVDVAFPPAEDVVAFVLPTPPVTEQ